MTNVFRSRLLDEVLSDPLVQDVMASDGVDPAELAGVAQRDRRRYPPATLIARTAGGGVDASLSGLRAGSGGFRELQRAGRVPHPPSPSPGERISPRAPLRRARAV